MHKLAVIGAGELGSRHLQALTLIDRPVSIQVVDPSSESLARAHERFGRAGPSGKVEKVGYLRKLAELAPKLDLVIVATTSAVRRSVIEELLSQKKVRFLILEKVLFQKPRDFEIVNDLLERKGVRAWTNCPRRMWPLYKKLKDKIRGVHKVDFSATGSKWGLGCNSIHLIDLFVYLTGQTEIEFFTEQLNPEVIDSKRPGYAEFTGTLRGVTSRMSTLVLTSYPSGDAPFVVQLSCPDFCCLIHEVVGGEGKIWSSEKSSGWKLRDEPFYAPFQSQLTHLAVQQILDSGNCELTAYEESSKLHLPLINALMKHMQENIREEIKLCPIT